MVQNLENLADSLKNLNQMLKNHWPMFLLVYTTVVSLSVLSDWISRSSYFGFFSLVLPLFLSLLFFGITWTFAFFVLPYFFQKHLKKNHCNLKPFPFTFFFRKKILLWVKETCRVFFLSYAFAFLFILPGIILFLRCSFVSSIVLFGKKQSSYRKVSSQMSQGRMSHLAFLWFVFIGVLLVLDFSGSSINQFFGLKTNLLSSVITFAWFLGYSCFLSLHLHSMYRSLSAPSAHRPSLQPVSELSL